MNIYELQPGSSLTPYEKKYLKVGIWLTVLSPIQFYLFFTIVVCADADIVFLQPFVWFVGYAIMSGFTHFITMYVTAGSYKLALELNETLGITKISIFSFHAGIIMTSRIVVILVVRNITGNKEFRLNYPYIFYEE